MSAISITTIKCDVYIIKEGFREVILCLALSRDQAQSVSLEDSAYINVLRDIRRLSLDLTKLRYKTIELVRYTLNQCRGT